MEILRMRQNNKKKIYFEKKLKSPLKKARRF